MDLVEYDDVVTPPQLRVRVKLDTEFRTQFDLLLVLHLSRDHDREGSVCLLSVEIYANEVRQLLEVHEEAFGEGECGRALLVSYAERTY